MAVGLLSTQKLFSCASPLSCFERKPKSWRIWEIPLAMPLFCISLCARQPGRLFSFLTNQRVKDLEHSPPNPTNMAKKEPVWVFLSLSHSSSLIIHFFITITFILVEIQLNKSGLYPLLLPMICSSGDGARGPMKPTEGPWGGQSSHLM